MMPLLCKHCGHWYQPERVVPEICPFCEQSAHWAADNVTKPFTLTENDRRFLKSIRIASNNDHEADGA